MRQTFLWTTNYHQLFERIMPGIMISLFVHLTSTETRIEFKLKHKENLLLWLWLLNPSIDCQESLYILLFIPFFLSYPIIKLSNPYFISISKLYTSLWLLSNLMTNFSVEMKKGEIIKMWSECKLDKTSVFQFIFCFITAIL